MKACVLVVLVVVAQASCKKDVKPPCSARVAKLEAALATPRSIEEIRKAASPALAADLDQVATQGDASARGNAYAARLEKAVAGCPAAVKVLGELGSIEGSRQSYLQQKFPPAIQECGCAASPEHAGGLVEALFADAWRAPH